MGTGTETSILVRDGVGRLAGAAGSGPELVSLLFFSPSRVGIGSRARGPGPIRVGSRRAGAGRPGPGAFASPRRIGRPASPRARAGPVRTTATVGIATGR